MKTIIKFLFICLICIASIAVLYLAGVLAYGTLTTFNPEETEILPVEDQQTAIVKADSSMTLLTWNLGYAGLGREMDFFYEGGRMVRPEEKQVNHYFEGIAGFLVQNDSIDIMLLQEVDFNSKRSYGLDEYELLKEKLPAFASAKATNYQSGFVPVPFSEPMGKVLSGMAVLSKFQIRESKRVSTPGSHAWPKSLFILKRCFMVNRLPVENSKKELVVVNVHNSAFGDEEDFRRAELELLKDCLLKEYRAGNYVVAGGDWNQNPPGFDPGKIRKYESREGWPIRENYLPDGWNWSWDPTLPSNRDVVKPFDLQNTSTTILDFFVTSPNVKVLNIQTRDLGFENSDHLPVIINIKLN